jgi:hypothetical protein
MICTLLGVFGLLVVVAVVITATQQSAHTPAAAGPSQPQSITYYADGSTSLGTPTPVPTPPAPTLTTVPTTVPTAKPTQAADTWLNPGDKATVKAVIMAATSKEGIDEVYKAINAKDDVGLQLLYLNGTVVNLQPGTQVQVIGVDNFLQVRVLSGPAFASAVWVPRASLQAT